MSEFLQTITTMTPDGEFHIFITPDGTAVASGFGDLETLHGRLPDDLQRLPYRILDSHPYQAYVKAYYSGDATALDKIPRTQSGTDFRQKVWDAIATIPYGATISYKELAQKSGNEAAVRAAGTVCGLNRLILIISCHRVLKSDGSTGSYLYGTAIKESLLRREGALI